MDEQEKWRESVRAYQYKQGRNFNTPSGYSNRVHFHVRAHPNMQTDGQPPLTWCGIEARGYIRESVDWRVVPNCKACIRAQRAFVLGVRHGVQQSFWQPKINIVQREPDHVPDFPVRAEQLALI